MEFYTDLYIGEKVEKPGVLLKKIKKQKKIPDAYIIAFAQSADDELDIRNAKDLNKEFYASENPYIVGIAEDYDDAVDVVKKIAEECFAKRGDCRLRDFLSERIQ